MKDRGKILQQVNKLLDILGIISEDLAEISKALKSIAHEKTVTSSKRIEIIDKENLFRVILWSLKKYGVSGLMELASTLKDPKAIHLAETKEWNKLMDYLYKEKYSELVFLYNKTKGSKFPIEHYEESVLADELAHKQEHKQEYKGIFECPYCNKAFSAEEELQEHERKVHT